MTDARPGTPALLDELLHVSSRTFALTIPMLQEPTRLEVTVAYLLFRIADTIEDSTGWSRDRKVAELMRFDRLLEAPSVAEASRIGAAWDGDPPIDHPGYRRLLAATPEVFRAARSVSPEAWDQIADHTRRTTRGMSAFVAREADGAVRLRDLADLGEYCYTVAGIVGEMLTELFLLGREALAGVAPKLRRDARVFGEGLQLVNILKDAVVDSTEGRRFLPRGLDREAIFGRARRDLATAGAYCARLASAGAERGLVAFTALPVLLADATLDRVRERGPGAKLSRAEVAAIVEKLQVSLDEGRAGVLFSFTPPGEAGGEANRRI